MEREIIVFAVFAALAILFNHIEENMHTHPKTKLLHRVLYHENTLHALRDYAIHFMVYSGYVLGH